MRLRFPHPLVLLVAFVGLAAIGSWILPAGQYQRRQDEATGREVVVYLPRYPGLVAIAIIAIIAGVATGLR